MKNRTSLLTSFVGRLALLYMFGWVMIAGYACTHVEVLEEVVVESEEAAAALLKEQKPNIDSIPGSSVVPDAKSTSTNSLDKIIHVVGGVNTDILAENSSSQRSTVGYISKGVYQGVGNRDVYYSEKNENSSEQYAVDPAKIDCACTAIEGENLCAMRDSAQGFEVMRHALDLVVQLRDSPIKALL